jgi:hypothetical protein
LTDFGITLIYGESISNQRIEVWFYWWWKPQGLAVIFSHHQVYVKRRREGTFFAAQSQSRISAPFFASKTV